MRGEARADQIEIGDAIDLVIIGDAGVAIAEADLGTDIDLAAGDAGGLLAAEGAARRPAVARERPGDLAPTELLRAEVLTTLGARLHDLEHSHRPDGADRKQSDHQKRLEAGHGSRWGSKC